MKTLKALEECKKELERKIKAKEFWEGDTSSITWYFNIDENTAKEILEKLVEEKLLIKRYGIICENCGAEVELEEWQIKKIKRLSPEALERLESVNCQGCGYSFKPEKDAHLSVLYRRKDLPIDKRYVIK
jgi:RNA polymerase-binding transcription factor DksA